MSSSAALEGIPLEGIPLDGVTLNKQGLKTAEQWPRPVRRSPP
jgi:hypothetical protein